MNGAGLASPPTATAVYDWVTSGAAIGMPGGAGWFGPGRPLAPAATGAGGRRWDYPAGANLNYHPKRGEGVAFAELRAFADAYDLLRLVIETRKDEMEFLEWRVQGRDGRESKASKRMQGFLASPDGEGTWHQWQRTLLEELFVTDAPAIYVRRTMGGDPYALEIVDGGTIKRLLDDTGRTPAEGPAYQQVLHGVVAADYDRSELIYCPRNVRVNRVYGYSPVEQVITTVNIALRRQAHQLSYYTEGSVPDLMFQVPEGWDARQIQEFQTWWASLFAEGNVANRRMARFVPHGVTPFNTKEAALKDQYDEWLARIICFAFSVSPQALVAQMNRATAEVAQEAAQGAGLEPIKNWLKGTMDRILCEVYGEPGLEFVWLAKEAIDPEAQSRIHAAYVQCGVMGVDEVREAIGLEARGQGGMPIAGAQMAPGAFGASQGAGQTSPPSGVPGPHLTAAQADVGPANGVQGPGGSPPPVQGAPGGAPVQDTALNGAQVSSLVQIIESVTGGILPKESAIQLIQAAFPSLSDERVRGIINPLDESPKTPTPVPEPPKALGDPGDHGPGGPPQADHKSGGSPQPDQSGAAKMAGCDCHTPQDDAGALRQVRWDARPMPGGGPGGDPKRSRAQGAVSNAPPPGPNFKKAVRIDHARKPIKRMAEEMREAIAAALAERAAAIAAAIEVRGIGRAGSAPDDWGDETGKADGQWAPPTPLFPIEDWMGDFGPLRGDLEKLLERAAKSGGTTAMNELRDYMKNTTHAEFTGIVNQVSWNAVLWAREASAVLVKRISEATMESLRNLVAAGVAEGQSVRELAAAIESAHAFSRERAELIAATELAFADVRGNKMAYAESGVVGGLQWITANNGTDGRIGRAGTAPDGTCEDCEMNHLAIVPMGADGNAAAAYPSGATGVPAHPRCLCDEMPVIREDA